MVTASTSAAPAGEHVGLAIWGVIEGIAVVGWILLFATLLIYMAVLITSRRRGQRRRDAAPRVVTRAATEPPGLDALRRADPDFDEQLLLDAALTATFLMFAATSTGDEAPIRRVVTDSFWETPFGLITRTTARDRRRENAEAEKRAAQGPARKRRWNIPVDYHPSVPELTTVERGRQQRVGVRVSFAQLQAVIQPGAEDFAAGAAATSFTSAMTSIGKTVAAQTTSPRPAAASWVAASGHYELTFVRPADARTEPSAVLADRTCTACGATYQSELATSCAYCQAPRPMPWGQWLLASAEPAG